MITAAPTIVTIETNSAWVVILAVSLVTLPVALLLRRLIDRPGALASSILLGLPLGLPLVAALFFQKSVLPEVSVLQPLAPEVFEKPDWGLLHFLFVADGASGGLVPYVLSGAPGTWLLALGAGFTSFMLLRRLAGAIALRRLVSRCQPLDRASQQHLDLAGRVAVLASAAGLRTPPTTLFLPPDVPGAFVTGIRTQRILISARLVEDLTSDELDGILAHEIAHIASRDIPVMVIGGVLRDLVAWNPVAHVALRRLVAEREFEADRLAALLTGKPLALASSLLRMCELMRSGPSRAVQPGLGFLRKGAGLRRRVANLLVLADGPSRPLSGTHLPYIAAACLAAVLGLQAGARVAQQADFAIVWGAAETRDVPLWFKDRGIQAQRARAQQEAAAAARAKGRRGDARGVASARFSLFGNGYLLREKDLPRWIDAMALWAKRRGLSPRILTAEVTQGWRAVPLPGTPQIGPFGFYRISALTRPLPGPQPLR
ncbi:MAG: M56 family metallopeptidase [Actinomycetota bacterium]|nr:M56 family metallopeptidase [Actinomycetota bacterium]